MNFNQLKLTDFTLASSADNKGIIVYNDEKEVVDSKKICSCGLLKMQIKIIYLGKFEEQFIAKIHIHCPASNKKETFNLKYNGELVSAPLYQGQFVNPKLGIYILNTSYPYKIFDTLSGRELAVLPFERGVYEFIFIHDDIIIVNSVSSIDYCDFRYDGNVKTLGISDIVPHQCYLYFIDITSKDIYIYTEQ